MSEIQKKIDKTAVSSDAQNVTISSKSTADDIKRILRVP